MAWVRVSLFLLYLRNCLVKKLPVCNCPELPRRCMQLASARITQDLNAEMVERETGDGRWAMGDGRWAMPIKSIGPSTDRLMSVNIPA